MTDGTIISFLYVPGGNGEIERREEREKTYRFVLLGENRIIISSLSS